MKVRAKLKDGTSYTFDLETNKLPSLEAFDDVVKFARETILIDLDKNRVIVQEITTYKEIE